MARTIGGILAGVIVATVLITLVQMAGHAVYPPPEGMDPYDAESIRQHMEQIPLGSLLFVLAAYAVGCFAGGYTSTRIARTGTITPALVVGIIYFLFGIVNLMMIPHPVWFMIATQLTYIAAAWAGGRIGEGQR